MSDEKTLAVYNDKVDDYREMIQTLQESEALELFMAEVCVGGLILDLGCGPGKSSAHMFNCGYRVDPVDASSAMVEVANEHFPIHARLATFDAIDQCDYYDGIWANFSLLHATREEFPTILAALFNALKPGGAFHIGMKTGEGEQRDELGRFYTFYTRSELEGYLKHTGFQVLSGRVGKDKGLAGTVDPWVTILSRKPATG